MANVITQRALIPSGQSVSQTLDLSELSVCRIEMPQEWTTANLTLQTTSSAAGSIFNNVVDINGTELTIVATAAQTVAIQPAVLSSLRYVRLRSGTSGTPVNQGADREILVVAHAWDDI